MKDWIRAACLVAAAAAAVSAGGGEPPRAEAARPAARKAEQLVQAQPPPFSEGVYPCSQCHDKPGDRTRRALGYHDEIQAIFDHDAEHRWCLDCHDVANRDVLHLSNGDPVPFTESYRLCGQCHGDKFRDWRVGVHGKRVGAWNGAKTYFLCVNCHNPHSPRFKGVKEIEVGGRSVTQPTLELLAPLPRPQRPEEMRP
ncbi:MAG TPA: hypothetical protein VLU43_12965 [Anaeromyxobacteraceae bacterium]|nr:hypothetical protein [Anaeromyxobacteraceae bacterium]